MSVSVVIPHYRAPKELARALRSVYEQTQPPVEVIVVDDQSGECIDEVRRLLEESPEHVRTRLIIQPNNRGPGAARNTGWDHATQTYVAFLDADDTWLPHKLEAQVGAMERLGICISGHVMAEIGSHLGRAPAAWGGVSRRASLARNPYATSSVMLRREVVLRFPERRYSEDFELWLSILSQYGAGIKYSGVLGNYYQNRLLGTGLSARQGRMALGELRTFTSLWQARRISAPEAIAGMALSAGKSTLRIVKTTLVKARVSKKSG